VGSPRSRREMRGSFWSPAGVEQLRASMDASGFAYQHSRLRLRQGFRATDEPRNSAVGMALAVAHPNRLTEIVPLFSGNCAR
jgi:hypothetical protein